MMADMITQKNKKVGSVLKMLMPAKRIWSDADAEAEATLDDKSFPRLPGSNE